MVQRYPTDLTDTECTILAPLIPAAKPGGRPRTTDMREVVHAIFYVLRGGCQWRLLPTDFPPPQTRLPLFPDLAMCRRVGADVRPPVGGSACGLWPHA
jgi:transposase